MLLYILAVTAFLIPYLLLLLIRSQRNDFFENFKDKIILITGTTSGLGNALAWKLASEGAQIIMCSRNVDKMAQIKKDMMTRIKNCLPPRLIRLDLACDQSIDKALEELKELEDKIHIVISNAGVSSRGRFTDFEMKFIREVMQTNYFGPLQLIQGILKNQLCDQTGQCMFVFISSMQSKISCPNRCAYGPSKAAVGAFSDVLRSELYQQKDFSANVLSVYPYYIVTDLSSNSITSNGSSYQKHDERRSALSADCAAKQIVDAIKAGKEEIIIAPLFIRVAVIIRSVWPSLIFEKMKHYAS